MAGYVIHLAVGEEYLRLHPNEIKNYDEFINGIIAPDGVEDKSQTHYGPKSSKVNLKKFFRDKDIENDFNKGYFLHLVTDYLFYNKFLEYFSKDIYDDYDILNERLEKEFRVKVPEKVRNKVFHKNGETKILDYELTKRFIRETAQNTLNEIKTLVLENNKKWLEFKNNI